MKTLAKSLCLLGFLAFSTGVLSAQNDPPPVAKIAAKPFDYGTIEGSIYTNKTFGLRFSAPETWEIQPREFGSAVIEAGQGVLKGKTKQMQNKLNDALQKVKILLSAKKTLGSEGIGVFMCGAEPLSALFITSGTDYLRSSLNGQKASILPPGYEVIYQIKQDKIGAKTLPYYEARTPNLKQRFYAVVKKGYGIFFVLTYVEDADLETMRNILKDADFALK